MAKPCPPSLHRTPRGRSARVLALACACSASATAQQDGRAVDRGVGDLTANATSHRWKDPGIGQFNQDTAVTANTRWVDQRVAQGRAYTFNAPGMRAHYNRGSYLVIDNDGFLAVDVAAMHENVRRQLIPENTVFDLTLPQTLGPRPVGPGQLGGRDMVYDYRVDGRIHARLNHAPGLPAGGAPAAPPDASGRIDGRLYAAPPVTVRTLLQQAGAGLDAPRPKQAPPTQPDEPGEGPATQPRD
ncbi:MAG: hypothetical protein AAGA57_06525 [Planctomycetota bacterium]